MKRTLFAFSLLVLAVTVCFGQLTPSTTANVSYGLTVSTENVRNQSLYYTGASSQDTLKPQGAVTATSTPGYAKYICAIAVTTAVASDSIFVWQSTAGGTKYIAKIIVPATAAPANFVLPLNQQVDSSYVIIKRYKTSDVNLIHRQKLLRAHIALN